MTDTHDTLITYDYHWTGDNARGVCSCGRTWTGPSAWVESMLDEHKRVQAAPFGDGLWLGFVIIGFGVIAVAVSTWFVLT